jgi:hypothetical protein
MGGTRKRGVVDTVAGQVARIRTHREECVVTGQVLQGWNQWGVAAGKESQG